MNRITIGILIGLGVTLLLLASYIKRTYNWLIVSRINVDKQYAHMEAHLKKKFDLIPAITDIVKGYSKHEKRLLAEVTALRSQWGKAVGSARIKTGNMLEATLSKLMVVNERYPNIKADKAFASIMHRINCIEYEIVNERKVYNKRVAYYNARVETFPSLIIAKLFGFGLREFYTLEVKK